MHDIFIKVLIPNMMNTLVRGGKYQNSVLHKIRQSQPCYKSAKTSFFIVMLKYFQSRPKKKVLMPAEGVRLLCSTLKI